MPRVWSNKTVKEGCKLLEMLKRESNSFEHSCHEDMAFGRHPYPATYIDQHLNYTTEQLRVNDCAQGPSSCCMVFYGSWIFNLLINRPVPYPLVNQWPCEMKDLTFRKSKGKVCPGFALPTPARSEKRKTAVKSAELACSPCYTKSLWVPRSDLKEYQHKLGWWELCVQLAACIWGIQIQVDR